MSKREPLEAAEASAQRVGRLIGNSLPSGWGFVLIMGTYEPGYATYVSNLERDGAVKMIRELADKIESGKDEA